MERYESFKQRIAKVLPIVYDPALTATELLYKIIAYLNQNTNIIKIFGNELEEIKKLVNELEDFIKSENAKEYILDLINEIINELISSGVIINTRWNIDVERENNTALLPTNVSFNEIAKFSINKNIYKTTNVLNFGYNRDYLKKFFNISDDFEISINNGLVAKNTSGTTKTIRLPIGGRKNFLYGVVIDMRGESVGRYRIGIEYTGFLILIDKENDKIYVQKYPDYADIEIGPNIWGEVLKIEITKHGSKIDLMINDEFVSSIEDAQNILNINKKRTFNAIAILNNNNSVRFEKAYERISCGYSFKDCSYIRYLDGELFTANNRAYLTCTSEFPSGGSFFILSHTLGHSDFILECEVDTDTQITNLYFDRKRKKFVALLKNWYDNKIGYSILNINNFSSYLKKNFIAFPESNNKDIFGSSDSAEDVEMIIYNDNIYIAYSSINEENIFEYSIFMSDSSDIELNNNDFKLYSHIHDNATGGRFIIINGHLYFLYGSTNSIKLYDVLNKTFVGLLDINVDNRPWANIVLVPEGSYSKYYITTFDRTNFTSGTHGYGNIAMYESNEFIAGSTVNNTIGVR